MSTQYQKVSALANAEFKYHAAKEEIRELVLSLLPEDGSRIDFDFIDDAGNEISEISRNEVFGDEGLTQYPFDELTIDDLFQIAGGLIHPVN